MVHQIFHDTQPQVREWTHGERHALLRQFAHQSIVADRRIAVIDPPHTEQLEGLSDVLGRSLLAGVRHGQEPLLTSACEDPLELRRRMAPFGGVETDRNDPVAVRERLIERCLGSFLVEMAEEAKDQLRADAELAPCVQQGSMDSIDYDGERNPTVRVCLRIEEDLRVQDVVALHSRQVGPGEVVEILLGVEHSGSLVVEIQKILKTVKLIGSPEGVDRFVRKFDLIALGHLEQQLRLECSLDVHVELGLGKPSQEGRHVVHGSAVPHSALPGFRMVTKLFDEQQIERRVQDLAGELAKSFSGEFTIVGILKGSFVFVADLVRALDRVGLAPRIEFIRLSSYQASRDRSELTLVGPPPTGMLGPVLLVDDIADTGWSLRYATDLLRPQALAIQTCTLIDKPSRRQVEITPDFVGFTVDDVFVVGYGIDHAEAHRHLPWIGKID